MATSARKKLSPSVLDELSEKLETRFEKNKDRHKSLEWERVAARLLEAAPEKLWALNEMERTGGEPDVVKWDEKTGELVFFDCAAESPKGRRSLCYDRKALESRKKFKPKHSAVEMAEEMGVELLTEEQYKQLQQLGKFDTKTSSWLETPAGIRKLGGAIFGDRRFGRVFIYHNGAESYYAARGFRASLKI
ncbi:Protein of unknown function [Salinimicrobium catena]|uniref:DUF4256 domain-containing protein n=1 Tax=Salinimicrobium catena TaxID=390640 RepID=A0A1H5P8Z9_9FLAO|nr:DUF4256 domain-containing protein [Salinimicrobium catena]SDL70283.1 Protein of unknown function [Salinimicrobium catena]SEF09551.1 Protein of unknown function [Salinimicrobium catena]